MKDFLFNLAVLIGFAIVFVIAFPSITRGVLQVYNGLGILPIFIIMVILAALPRKSRGRNRYK